MAITVNELIPIPARRPPTLRLSSLRGFHAHEGKGCDESGDRGSPATIWTDSGVSYD